MLSLFEYSILITVDSIIVVILQVRPLRHREVKRLAQDHTTLESRRLVSKVYVLPHSTVLPVLGRK